MQSLKIKYQKKQLQTLKRKELTKTCEPRRKRNKQTEQREVTDRHATELKRKEKKRKEKKKENKPHKTTDLTKLFTCSTASGPSNCGDQLMATI